MILSLECLSAFANVRYNLRPKVRLKVRPGEEISMAKHISGRLSARAAATAKAGRHADGLGLYLAVSDSGARKWIYRFALAGRVTEMGLGSGATVTLAQARSLAA